MPLKQLGFATVLGISEIRFVIAAKTAGSATVLGVSGASDL